MHAAVGAIGRATPTRLAPAAMVVMAVRQPIVFPVHKLLCDVVLYVNGEYTFVNTLYRTKDIQSDQLALEG